MKTVLQELTPVALLMDIPEYNLQRGQVGTIVEILSESVFEVEFCDNKGRTINQIPVEQKDLLLLRYEA